MIADVALVLSIFASLGVCGLMVTLALIANMIDKHSGEYRK